MRTRRRYTPETLCTWTTGNTWPCLSSVGVEPGFPGLMHWLSIPLSLIKDGWQTKTCAGDRTEIKAGGRVPGLFPAWDAGDKIQFQGLKSNGAGEPGEKVRARKCGRGRLQIPETRGHAQSWAVSFSFFFYFFFFSEPQYTSAWVGWSLLEGPVTGRTIFPTAGDSWHTGIQSPVEWVVCFCPSPLPMLEYVFAALDPANTEHFPCCLN